MGLDARKPDLLQTTKAHGTQPDQHHCNFLSGKYNLKTCHMQNFKILSSLLAEQAGLSMIWSDIPKACLTQNMVGHTVPMQYTRL